MSDEEKVEYCLSYKDRTGTEVFESLVVGTSPRKDIEDRIAFLERHGYTDIRLLDANKNPIAKPD